MFVVAGSDAVALVGAASSTVLSVKIRQGSKRAAATTRATRTSPRTTRFTPFSMRWTGAANPYGSETDPLTGRIGYVMTDPAAAAALALDQDLPFAACP